VGREDRVRRAQAQPSRGLGRRRAALDREVEVREQLGQLADRRAIGMQDERAEPRHRSSIRAPSSFGRSRDVDLHDATIRYRAV
jgi:hypothetical protein